MPEDKNENMETRFYHTVVMALGAILIMVIGWVGIECSHIPVIETKLNAIEENMANTTTWQTHKIGEHDAQLLDHEKRIQRIEDGNSNHHR